jgi:beta-phosphoglucomutase-like phosphatase (HAD superfamily)
VVEDSLFGLKAGRAAGMRVAAYLGAAHQTEELMAPVLAAKPEFVLNTITDLLDVLAPGKRAN